MKLEILRSDQGVEIHLHNEDGSITIWLCDSDQAAIFKLSSIIFSTSEDPKMAKRSILVGDFEPETPKKEKPLAERAEEVKKRLVGLVPTRNGKASEEAMDIAGEQFKELLEQLKKGTIKPLVFDQPYLKPMFPSVPNYPMTYPYVGDGVGSFPYGSIEVDVNVTNPYGGSAIGGCLGSGGAHSLDLGELNCFTTKSEGQLVDTEVAKFMNSNHCQVSVFKTSYKATG